MIFKHTKNEQKETHLAALRKEIMLCHHQDEEVAVERLLRRFEWTEGEARRVQSAASMLVESIRTHKKDLSYLTDFLSQYGLSSQEGIVLMCLSEALLRIPDSLTANLLIRDKLAQFNLSDQMGKAGTFIVNASTLALRFVNNFLSFDNSLRIQNKDIEEVKEKFWGILGRVIGRSGEPVIRSAIRAAIKILGNQFIVAESIDKALESAEAWKQQGGYAFSYDMLGEGARTHEDAATYAQAYVTAVRTLASAQTASNPLAADGVSVKLSALTPHFDDAHAKSVMDVVLPRMREICVLAARAGLNITIDAEEAKHLDLTLDIFEALAADPALANWNGLGLAVQAYQKRSLAVIDFLAGVAKNTHRRVLVRLVKGAYWDTEIKQGQVDGHEDYAVFTKKTYTDLSYLACAQQLFAHGDLLYPQFATHNAITFAAVQEMAKGRTDYEFQKLYGMGDELYIEAMKANLMSVKCRIYAPVGVYRDLLPYLVRRLLENGANSSFLHHLFNPQVSVETVVRDTRTKAISLLASSDVRKRRMVKPMDLFEGERRNSAGFDFSDRLKFHVLETQVQKVVPRNKAISSLIFGQKAVQGDERAVLSPVNRGMKLGTLVEAPAHIGEQAMRVAKEGFKKWEQTSPHVRALALERAADLLERDQAKLIAILIYEAGKTYPDAVAEIREAVDFCRYYAAHGRQLFGVPYRLHGPTGESNDHALAGRGVFVAISPWNFPLAIFMGQVTAALMAGNAVVAKPALQTSIIAYEAVRILHEAGIPEGALQLIIGRGSVVGPVLMAHSALAGVVFTGSFETAKTLQQNLAARSGAILPLIAETGGLNAMIVDSSALLEQVVDDVVMSAFRSAGQRCSCLRVLYVQEEIADSLIAMLKGAMADLKVGDPSQLSTDVGPVIDEAARDGLETYVRSLNENEICVGKTPLPKQLPDGLYFAPQAYVVREAASIQREIFGPVLHIVKYAARDMAQVIDAVNATGFGLTLGIHSRIDHTISFITRRAQVGNIYVNRNMIGAVVGVQPFGGEGLSGTGPKAGGIYYMLRFATERVLTVNTAAIGGNVDLVTQCDE